jgi:hypothetical protein
MIDISYIFLGAENRIKVVKDGCFHHTITFVVATNASMHMK